MKNNYGFVKQNMFVINSSIVLQIYHYRGKGSALGHYTWVLFLALPQVSCTCYFVSTMLVQQGV